MAGALAPVWAACLGLLVSLAAHCWGPLAAHRRLFWLICWGVGPGNSHVKTGIQSCFSARPLNIEAFHYSTILLSAVDANYCLATKLLALIARQTAPLEGDDASASTSTIHHRAALRGKLTCFTVAQIVDIAQANPHCQFSPRPARVGSSTPKPLFLSTPAGPMSTSWLTESLKADWHGTGTTKGPEPDDATSRLAFGLACQVRPHGAPTAQRVPSADRHEFKKRTRPTRAHNTAPVTCGRRPSPVDAGSAARRNLRNGLCHETRRPYRAHFVRFRFRGASVLK